MEKTVVAKILKTKKVDHADKELHAVLKDLKHQIIRRQADLEKVIKRPNRPSRSASAKRAAYLIEFERLIGLDRELTKAELLDLAALAIIGRSFLQPVNDPG